MPLPAANRDPVNDPALCGHYGHKSKRSQQLCQNPVIAGTHNCRMHPGKKISQLKAEGEIVREYQRLRMSDLPPVQPRSMILQLVAVSSYLVNVYWNDLQKALEEADDDVDKALTGHSYSVSPETGAATKTGEYIRMRQKRFDDERDRCGKFCGLAITAKATEDLVEEYKRMGQVSAGLVVSVARELGIPVDSEDVQRLMVTHLQRLAPQAMTIEGTAA